MCVDFTHFLGVSLMLCCKQAICVALVVFAQIASAQMPSRPNILLLMAEDMSALNGMTTETISVLVQGCLGMGLAVIMSSYFSWRTTLLTLAASPILMIGVYGMSRLQWGNNIS